MSYVFGSVPKYGSLTPVAEDYLFQAGEWGRCSGSTETASGLTPDRIPSAQQAAQALISKLRTDYGVSVWYLKMNRSVRLQGGYVDRYIATYTVEDMWFRQDAVLGTTPLIAPIVLGIIYILGLLLAIEIVWVLAPVILKAAGVSPADVWAYMTPFIILGVLALGVLMVGTGFRLRGGGERA